MSYRLHENVLRCAQELLKHQTLSMPPVTVTFDQEEADGAWLGLAADGTAEGVCT